MLTTWNLRQDPSTHKITDFVSIYSLPSTIIHHEKHKLLNAAYLFYYATEVAFQPNAEASGRLTKRLEELVGDALVIAENAGFDVLNAMTLMDNVSFLRNLKVSSPHAPYGWASNKRANTSSHLCSLGKATAF